MTFTETIRCILNDSPVIDIGQISNETRRWLQRAKRRGLVRAEPYYGFPIAKTQWFVDRDHAPELRSLLKRDAENNLTPVE